MADNTPKRRKTDEPTGDRRTDSEGRRDSDYREKNEVREHGYQSGTNPAFYWAVAILGILLVGFIVWLLYLQGYRNQNITNQNIQTQGFADQNKTNNFDQSIPSHGDVVPAAPPAVIVQTNNTNTSNSNLTINKDNQDYGTGRVIIEANGNNLRRTMDPDSPEGIYTVNYSSCNSGGSCQNGSYQFRIENDEKSTFQDLTNQRNVTISVNGNKFNPENIIIARNTRVTWTNNNNSELVIGPGLRDVQDFVKTVVPTGKLAAGQNVSFTFNEQGYYPIIVFSGNQMIIGKIIVE